MSHHHPPFSSTTTHSQQHRIVLNEDDYYKNMNEVIQRQFYPDLIDLQTAVTLDKKRAAGDVAGVVAVRRAARQLKEHDQVIEENEQYQDAQPVRSYPRPLHLETLTGFHSRVTSEDNAEFEHVQAEELQHASIERRNMLLLTNHSTVDTQQHSCRGRTSSSTSLFVMASDAFDAPSYRPEPKAAALENGLFFVPRSNDVFPKNSGTVTQLFMPPPSTLSESHLIEPASSSLLAASALPSRHRHALAEFIPNNQIEKRIEPANTRFPQLSIQSFSASYRHGLQYLENDATRDSETSAATSDWESDLDFDSVAGSRDLSRHMQQGRKRTAQEMQTMIPLASTHVPSSSASFALFSSSKVNTTGLETIDESSPHLHTTSSTMTFQMPPRNHRDIAAEKALNVLQRRSHPSSNRAGQLTFSSASTNPSSRRSESVRSRSSLGLALRSSYGGRKGMSNSSSTRSITSSSGWSSRSQKAPKDRADYATPVLK